LEANFAG